MADDPIIAVLEDDSQRTTAMRAVLAEAFPGYRHEFFPTAPGMIGFLKENLGAIRLLSLDHDLGPVVEHGGPNSGTGMDVARFLARRDPVCHVILHSSHLPSVQRMEEELGEAGWNCSRVTAGAGTEWVATGWRAEVERCLR